MKLIAKVKYDSDEIKYLGIEYDEEKLGNGVFLFYLLEKDFGTCQHDGWFTTIKIAKEAASSGYGVKEDDWENYLK